MGIYDRDYIRADRRPPRGMSGMGGGVAPMRVWSVTTWLIVICAAVFVVDFFLPVRLVEVGGPYWLPNVTEVPATAVEGEVRRIAWTYRSPTERAIPPQFIGREILDEPGGQVIGYIHVQPMRFIESYMFFSTAELFQLELWRLIGFQFLHANFTHLLFNMIGLFFFGPIVENYLGRKRYLAFYLLAGIFGALLYLVLNLSGYVIDVILGADIAIPGLLFNDPRTPLVGASAGIFGILMAGAYLAPNAVVLLFFILPMRLKWVAYGLVAVSLFTLLRHGPNAGGEAGHLGGAIAGFYFIRHPHHLHGFFDILGYADPTSHHYHRSGRQRRAGRRKPKEEAMLDAEIDRILEKISREGMGELTSRERDLLRRASRRER